MTNIRLDRSHMLVLRQFSVRDEAKPPQDAHKLYVGCGIILTSILP
jgi:hypothetical protein